MMITTCSSLLIHVQFFKWGSVPSYFPGAQGLVTWLLFDFSHLEEPSTTGWAVHGWSSPKGRNKRWHFQVERRQHERVWFQLDCPVERQPRLYAARGGPQALQERREGKHPTQVPQQWRVKSLTVCSGQNEPQRSQECSTDLVCFCCVCFRCRGHEPVGPNEAQASFPARKQFPNVDSFREEAEKAVWQDYSFPPRTGERSFKFWLGRVQILWQVSRQPGGRCHG